MPGSYFQHARFRIILPTVYLVIGGVLFADCFLHIGHSPWCQYSFYLMLPIGLITGFLSHVLVPWGFVRQGSAVWLTVEMVLVPLPFCLAIAQYYLVGLLIDKLLSRRQGLSQPQKR